MLDDVARMSVGVQWAVGWGSWSVKSWVDTRRWSGTVRIWLGVVSPSCSAAAMVMTLFTDPGSNWAVKATLLLVGAAGLPGEVATLAMARISPVLGRVMIAVP